MYPKVCSKTAIFSLSLCLAGLPALADDATTPNTAADPTASATANTAASTSQAAPDANATVSQTPSDADMTAASQAVKFKFIAQDNPDSIAGPEADIFFQDASGKQTEVVAIPAGTKNMSEKQRAQTIAGNLQAAAGQDPKFWETLQPGDKNNQKVLKLKSTIDNGFILTADLPSAKKAGYHSQEAYAAFLLVEIQQILSPRLRDAKFDFQLTTPAEKQERAVEYYQSGKQFASTDTAHAIALFHQATLVSPQFASPYLAWANLDLKQQKLDEAEAVLASGVKAGADLSETFANNFVFDGQNSSPQLGQLLQKVKS